MKVLPKTHSVAVAGLLVALAVPACADVTDFGQGTKIGRVTTAPELSATGRKAYAEFRRKARYFGAFAAHPATGDVFYVMNFHDTQKARAAAIEGCAQLADAQGCGLVGVAMPESLPIDQAQASGMSEGASDAFATVYREHRVPGKYAAFAISGSSHYGYANAWDSSDYATDTALAYCAIGVAKDMASIGPEGRRYAKRRNLDDCRVVDVELHSEN